MSIRDHYTPGQPPSWSRPAQAFRHLDGRTANWRRGHAVATAHRRITGIRARLRRAVRAVQTWCAFERVLLGPASNKRDIAIFATGMAWGVMCAIGTMAAWGIHP
jgi:hypothetical protein